MGNINKNKSKNIKDKIKKYDQIGFRNYKRIRLDKVNNFK